MPWKWGASMTDHTELGSSAGALLRRARESHGASLEALSATIKVPVAKLQALEADDAGRLPDPNFNRALAMTVCRALKVDAAPVLALMPAPVATVLTSGKPSLNEPYKDFADTGLTFDRSAHLGLALPKVPVAAYAAIGILGVAALILWLPDRSEWPIFNGVQQAEPAVAVPIQTESQPVALSASEASLPMPMASAAVASGPVDVAASAVQPVAASAVVVAAAASSAPQAAPLNSVSAMIAPAPKEPVASAPVMSSSQAGRITLSAKDAAWVEIRDGASQKIFSRHMKAGESVELQGQPPLKVHAGNAPVLSIQFNGKAVDLASVTRQNVARIELK